MKPMLMYICRYNRIRHQIHKILAPVRLYPQRQVEVWINVPEGLAKNSRTKVARAPSGVTATNNIGTLWWEFGGDIAMKVGMRRLYIGIGGDEVEIDCGEPRLVLVRHGLA